MKFLQVVLAVIFVEMNINNLIIRPYNQFHSLVTLKCVPLILECKYELMTQTSPEILTVSLLSQDGIKTLL